MPFSASMKRTWVCLYGHTTTRASSTVEGLLSVLITYRRTGSIMNNRLRRVLDTLLSPNEGGLGFDLKALFKWSWAVGDLLRSSLTRGVDQPSVNISNPAIISPSLRELHSVRSNYTDERQIFDLRKPFILRIEFRCQQPSATGGLLQSPSARGVGRPSGGIIEISRPDDQLPFALWELYRVRSNNNSTNERGAMARIKDLIQRGR